MKSYLRMTFLIGGVLVFLFLFSACRSSPTPTPRPEDTTIEMGLNVATRVDPLEAKEVELATASGSHWDRVAFHWHEIQPRPTPAPWNWSPADARYGNEPLTNTLGVLTSQPDVDPWHDAGVTYGPVDVNWDCAAAYIRHLQGVEGEKRKDGYCVFFNGLEQPIYKDGQINPDNQWAYFVYQTTSRYADRVSAWQIYNEDEFIISTTYNYLHPTQPLVAPISYYPDPVHFLDAVETAYQVIKVGGGGVPGNDQPDDNHSAATAQLSPAQFPSGVREEIRVGVLENGFFDSAVDFIAQASERAWPVRVEFDPAATLARYPVLLIPSGGPYGGANPRPRCPNPTAPVSIAIVTLSADGAPVWALVIVHWSLIPPACPACITA